MAVMTNTQFVKKCVNIAKNYKTLYVMGCYGAPLTTANKKRYSENHPYNRERKTMIYKATANTFGFDCSNLIKAVLWGWNGDKAATYGGAKYETNGVSDINADTMIRECTELSTNFEDIEIGEVVWCSGHIGVYIGDGLAVECTPRWANKVQITAVGNIGKKDGYNTRTWVKHGKLPYISYGESKQEVKETKKKYQGTFPTLPEKEYFAKGDTGKQVKNLQKVLNWCINANLSVDGIFGEKTENAVETFQKKYNLKVDGLFGAKSLAKAKSIKK